MEPTLYSDPNSFDSFVLRWIAIEKDCPIVHRIVYSWEVALATTPFFKDHNLFLVEHEAIVQYLQDRYPGKQLLPGDPKVRAQLRQICLLIRGGLPEFVKELKDIVNHQSVFIAGDQLSLADIYAGAKLRELEEEGVTFNGDVNRYYSVLTGREGFKEASE